MIKRGRESKRDFFLKERMFAREFESESVCEKEIER